MCLFPSNDVKLITYFQSVCKKTNSSQITTVNIKQLDLEYNDPDPLNPYANLYMDQPQYHFSNNFVKSPIL